MEHTQFKQQRIGAGVSQAMLARAAGCTQAAVSQFETGYMRPEQPAAKSMIRALNRLSQPVDEHQVAVMAGMLVSHQDRRGVKEALNTLSTVYMSVMAEIREESARQAVIDSYGVNDEFGDPRTMKILNVPAPTDLVDPIGRVRSSFDDPVDETQPL